MQENTISARHRLSTPSQASVNLNPGLPLQVDSRADRTRTVPVSSERARSGRGSSGGPRTPARHWHCSPSAPGPGPPQPGSSSGSSSSPGRAAAGLPPGSQRQDTEIWVSSFFSLFKPECV
eukprot:3078575-Rhodomonas_salina.3